MMGAVAGERSLEDEARALLARWHDAAPLLRLDPAESVRVCSARRIEIVQVVLRCVVEERTMEVVRRGGAPLERTELRYSPWDKEITIPSDAPAGTEVRELERSVLVSCRSCDGSGKKRCVQCEGLGRVAPRSDARSSDRVECAACRGRGGVPCGRCNGTGDERADVEVIARLVTRAVACPVPNDAYPLGVDEALSEPSSSGEILFSRTAPTLDALAEIPFAEGYRSHDAAALVARDLLPKLADRLRRQEVRSATIEVRRIDGLALEVALRESYMDIFSRRLTDGRLWIFDDPPRVAPEHLLVVDDKAKIRLAIVAAIVALIAFFAWRLLA